MHAIEKPSVLFPSEGFSLLLTAHVLLSCLFFFLQGCDDYTGSAPRRPNEMAQMDWGTKVTMLLVARSLPPFLPAFIHSVCLAKTDGIERVRIPRPASQRLRHAIAARPRGSGVVPCDRCGALLGGKPTASHYRSVACFTAYCATGLLSGSLVIDTGLGGTGGSGGGGGDASAAAVAEAVVLIGRTKQLLQDDVWMYIPFVLKGRTQSSDGGVLCACPSFFSFLQRLACKRKWFSFFSASTPSEMDENKTTFMKGWGRNNQRQTQERRTGARQSGRRQCERQE
jgi:hypothetical protein